MADDFLSGSVDEAASAIEAILNAAPEPDPKPAPEPEAPAPEIQPQAEAADTAKVEGANAGEDAQAPASELPAIVAEQPRAQPASSPELAQKLSEADQAKHEAVAVRDQLVTHLNTLNVLVPQLESAVRGEFADIKNFDDLQAVAQVDPDRYNRFVIAQARVQQAKQAQEAAQAEGNRLAASDRQQWQKTEVTKLGKLLPDLADPTKGPALSKQIQDYALKQGYSPEDLSRASARDFVLLHNSMKMEGLEAQRIEAARKAAKAPPVQQPGTQRVDKGNDKEVEARDRFGKTGRLDDLAALLSASG